MQLEKTILRSKVARRIFVLFVTCALLPVIVLTLFSSTFLGNELRDAKRQIELLRAYVIELGRKKEKGEQASADTGDDKKKKKKKGKRG